MSEINVTLDGLLEFGWCTGCGKPIQESVDEAHLEDHRMNGTEDEHEENTE